MPSTSMAPGMEMPGMMPGTEMQGTPMMENAAPETMPDAPEMKKEGLDELNKEVPEADAPKKSKL